MDRIRRDGENRFLEVMGVDELELMTPALAGVLHLRDEVQRLAGLRAHRGDGEQGPDVLTRRFAVALLDLVARPVAADDLLEQPEVGGQVIGMRDVLKPQGPQRVLVVAGEPAQSRIHAAEGAVELHDGLADGSVLERQPEAFMRFQQLAVVRPRLGHVLDEAHPAEQRAVLITHGGELVLQDAIELRSLDGDGLARERLAVRALEPGGHIRAEGRGQRLALDHLTGQPDVSQTASPSGQESQLVVIDEQRTTREVSAQRAQPGARELLGPGSPASLAGAAGAHDADGSRLLHGPPFGG